MCVLSLSVLHGDNLRTSESGPEVTSRVVGRVRQSRGCGVGQSLVVQIVARVGVVMGERSSSNRVHAWVSSEVSNTRECCIGFLSSGYFNSCSGFKCCYGSCFSINSFSRRCLSSSSCHSCGNISRFKLGNSRGRFSCGNASGFNFGNWGCFVQGDKWLVTVGFNFWCYKLIWRNKLYVSRRFEYRG